MILLLRRRFTRLLRSSRRPHLYYDSFFADPAAVEDDSQRMRRTG
jgi:hypothetical protein